MFQKQLAEALPLVFRESVGVSLVLHIYNCCAVLDCDRVTLRFGVHVHVQLPMTALTAGMMRYGAAHA